MSFFIVLRHAFAALLLAIGLTSATLAHEVKIGPNGGPLTDLGKIHLELVMKVEQIHLFVTDAKGEPVDVSAASANIIILAGTKKHITKLGPVADSILGSTFAVLDAGPYTIVAIVTIPGEKPFQGRFQVNELLAFLAIQSKIKT